MLSNNTVMGLKVISINVDSIVYGGRRQLLRSFIEKTNADIYLLQETKLDFNIKFSIPGYNIIRTDNIREMSGTAILIRSSIPIRHPIFFNDTIQATSVEFKSCDSWLRIVSCYFPPGRNISANLME